jgi:hypothetical protein
VYAQVQQKAQRLAQNHTGRFVEAKSVSNKRGGKWLTVKHTIHIAHRARAIRELARRQLTAAQEFDAAPNALSKSGYAHLSVFTRH